MLSKAAQKYREAGLNILPASRQTKRPMFSKWRGFCKELCSTTITNDATAICVVCGNVSGRVEIIDFDFQSEDFDAWKEELIKIDANFSAFLDALLIETTQNGGRHVAYRVEGETPLKTQKLTYRELFPSESEIKTKGKNSFVVYKGKEITRSADGRFVYGTIETRAEGAIALIAPTQGYEVIQGSWEELPVIPVEFRSAMFRAALALTCVKFEPKLKTTSVEWYDAAKIKGEKIDVAQYLRESDAAKKLLLQHGWTLASEYYDGGFSLWRRPGKTYGVSASLDNKTGRLWIFTTNGACLPLQANRTYTPLQLYAEYNTGGNERDASVEILQTLEKEELQRYENLDLSYLFGVKKEEPKPEIKVETGTVKSEPTIKSVYDIKLPSECINPGGWLERVMDYTDSISTRKQRALSFASAFTALGHTTARRVGVGAANSMLSPALFTLGISPPSSGKGAGLHVAQIVARAACHPAEISNGYESVQKFYDSLETTSKQFLVMDEFGAWLSAVNAEHACSIKTRLLNAWTEIYTSYNKTEFTAPSSIRKGKSVNIYRPAFSIYGVTNLSEFQNAFNGILLKNGFVTRYLFIFGDPTSPLIRKRDDEEDDENDAEGLPQKIIEETKAWEKIVSNSVQPACCEKPFRVRFEADADDEIFEYSQEVENRYLTETDDTRRAFFGRTTEKVKKYSLLFACSKFGANIDALRIDKECARKAIALNKYEHAIFKYLDESVLADSTEEKNVLDVENWIRKLKEQSFTLESFTNKFRKIKRSDRDVVLMTLQDKGLIEVCYEDNIGADGRAKQRKKSFKVLK